METVDARALPPLPADPKDWDPKTLSAKRVEMRELIGSPAWGVPTEAEGVQTFILQPTATDPIAKLKAIAEFRAPAAAVSAFYSDLSNYPTMDPLIIPTSAKELQRIDLATGSMSVRVGEWKLGWPIYNREFVWLYHNQLEEDGKTYTAISQSLQSHPSVPLREKEVVRGILIGDLLVIEALSDNSCRVTYVSAADPLGWLPTAVVNYSLSSAAGIVKKGKAHFEKVF